MTITTVVFSCTLSFTYNTVIVASATVIVASAALSFTYNTVIAASAALSFTYNSHHGGFQLRFFIHLKQPQWRLSEGGYSAPYKVVMLNSQGKFHY
jgi:hypothetical protein